MNLFPRWVWLRTVNLRRADAAPEPDPGDMGTAFGLDASLSEYTDAPPTETRSETAWQQRMNRRPER